ncbi:MAG: aminotransferase class I/II-fold pyridoxal phosphate-dependent enzyme [Proteobacteria bacterium]|nr:aminotransferase class I/II-fold pyridoxal phosphate-dependent enzyme [Pseudomonadota bacterium]
MIIHPKARSLISKLSLPNPIQKYFSNLDWEIDLSNNTNPYGGNFSEYPDVKQNELKKLYLDTILSINPPPVNDITLGIGNILFTAGSMEGIDLILRTFSEPKEDLVCVTSPSFSAYTHWALIHGIRLQTMPLLGDNLAYLDIETILRINPKMMFICNPNNPTGTKIAPNTIETLCHSMNGFVVVDEAYIEFSDDSSSLFCLNKYKNLIILRTFSKAWGLAGIRCGAILADTSVINTLRYVQLPFSISTPSQTSVIARLEDPKSTLESWEKIKKSRTGLIEELLTFKGVSTVFVSETNFIMVILKNFPQTMRLLSQQKIHVLDCSSSLPNAIRVSIGTESQNQRFLEVIRFASLA